VYVYLPEGFNYASWLDGLNRGRSFVTTGPMLLATVDGQPPGTRFDRDAENRQPVRVEGTVLSEQPLGSIEIVLNGQVVHRLQPESHKTAEGAFQAAFQHEVPLAGSSWVAVRCWEPRGPDRARFAHTAPCYFDVDGQPLRPRKEEAEFLAQRVRDQIARSKEILSPTALEEYRQALAIYEAIVEQAQ
jgi:hypothetical protein